MCCLVNTSLLGFSIPWRPQNKPSFCSICVSVFSFLLRRKYLTPLLSAPSERSRDISHLFNTKLFLKSCSSTEWPFFHFFFDTQIFNAFIEQRSFAHIENTSLIFFDECTEKVSYSVTS